MKKIWLIVILCLAIPCLAAKYDYLLEMGEKIPSATACKECHQAIYEDWARGFHAKAYINGPFKKGTADYVKKDCLPCHAPQTIAPEEGLILRTVHQGEGVNCATCHLRDNMIYGPYKLVAKHKAEQDVSMLKSAFCAGCHAPTYKEWETSGVQKSCQECHMPRQEGKTVQGFPLSALVPKRMIGRHLLSNETLLSDAASLSGEVKEESITITVTNKGAGHKMPTGIYGDYRLVLITKVKDTDGKVVYVKEETLSSTKGGSAIPYKGSTRYGYPLPAGISRGLSVEAVLVYQVNGRPEVTIATWITK